MIYTKKNSKKHSKKPSKKPIKNKTYIILKCLEHKYNNLHFDVLENYLNKLGIYEDNQKKIIDKIEYNYLKKNKISIEKYCLEEIKLPNINKFNIKYCDFMWINKLNYHFLNKRYYGIKTYLINMMEKNKYNLIYNKSELYNNFKLESPKNANMYMADTFNILDKDKYDFNGKNYYILRPIDSLSATDIFYINNQKDLDARIEYYKKTKNYKNILYNDNVIASKYIINPYLFKGKKFHLRLYYMISYIEKVFNSFLLDFGKITTSNDLYDTKTPFIKEKHDTHFKSTDNDYSYPHDLEINDNIKDNIKKLNMAEFHNDVREICKTLSKILINDKSKFTYDTDKNCFAIFGIDIMIDANTMKPILIECNKSPGISFKHIDNSVKFSKLFFKWINDVILEPTFKYKDQYVARKHPSYLDI
jgi:hypothetical protein